MWSEAAIAIASAVALAGYHLYFVIALKKSPERTMLGLARGQRRDWVAHIHTAGDGILAVQTLRNWMMSASFLASTAIIIAAGLLGFVFSAENVPALVHTVNLMGTANAGLLTVKLMLLVADFFAAFFNFSLSLRYYNYVALTVNTPDEAHPARRRELTTRYLELAARHYAIGMRGYYFSIPLAMWLFGPVWLAVGTIVLVIVLYRHDHAK